MTYIDITRPIHPGMAIYPNNPAVLFEQLQTASAQTSALTKITIGSHTGTHIDAPSHITAEAVGTGQYSLDQLNGPCTVIDLTAVANIITDDDIPVTSTERIILKTQNSFSDRDTFDETFIALDERAAQKLVEAGVKLVGIDALSIKKKGVKDQVHHIFLDAGVIIVEGLWLANVEPGDYELLCLPLPVDLDGAPVRVVLRKA
jgi:arylformamidase